MLDEAFARGWENLVGRWGGPMSFRLLVQPAVAILFAVRLASRTLDRTSHHFCGPRSPNPASLRKRSRQVWTDVGKVFIVAVILDSIYQVVVHAGIFTLELLITATVLALLPYVVSRGLVTRIARWAGVGKHTDHSMANREETRT